MTLKYDGPTIGDLKKGTYVRVPTNWKTGLGYGCVTKAAIDEIIEALEDKGITVDDYDYVFSQVDNMKPGELSCRYARAGVIPKVELLFWTKV